MVAKTLLVKSVRENSGFQRILSIWFQNSLHSKVSIMELVLNALGYITETISYLSRSVTSYAIIMKCYCNAKH